MNCILKGCATVGKKTSINNLASEISDIMASYAGEASGMLKEEVEAAGKLGLKVVKEKAPKETGFYRRNLKLTRIFENSHAIRFIIHAENGSWRVAHLLEKGHAKRNGGRVQGHPHFEPAEREIENYLGRAVELRIKGKG